MNSVLIYGQGIAALTAAWELAKRGHTVNLVGRGDLTAIQLALDPITVQLLEEIFHTRLVRQPFSHPISRRSIRGWYSTPTTIETDSLSISLDALVDHLRECLKKRFPISVTFWNQLPRVFPHHFVICATGRRDSDALTFGGRVAAMATVQLQSSLDSSVVERTDYGWAFLLPSSEDQAHLFASAANTDRVPMDLLDATTKSCSFRNSISIREAFQNWRRVAPSLSHPLATPSEIFVGESAFSVDPICGDGVGYAVRSALLAAIVVADQTRYETHGRKYYVARLLRAFYAHLAGCANVYAGWRDAGWSEEVQCMKRGMLYLRNQTAVA
ncbi:MAG: hypothetical protein KDA59_23745 [Planctomycetales bacterium]|nr:hypothetical protein [Planctomycetales bacterium]